MKTITDIVTITELARLTGRSRPTIYKWITLFETGKKDEMPQVIAELFDLISDTGSKKAIYQFCDERFAVSEDDKDLEEVFGLLRANISKLNLEKIKNFILEEINK